MLRRAVFFCCFLILCCTGCAPKRDMVLSADEYGSRYADIILVEAKEDAVYVRYQIITVPAGWRPWPWRSNTREVASLRFHAQGGDTYVVEVFAAPASIGMYQGETELGHGDPPALLAGEPLWQAAGSTADDTEYARIWEYVRPRLPK